MFRYVVWSAFFLAMGLTAWGLVRMEINETYKAFLGVGWLYLITCTFTGYEPTALRLGPLTRLGGRMSARLRPLAPGLA